MPGKSKKKKPAAQPQAAAALANLPEPERVPKTDVGQVVQDFINLGGATAIEAHQEDGDFWIVTATA